MPKTLPPTFLPLTFPSFNFAVRSKGASAKDQRIADPIVREAVFRRRKAALFKRAKELTDLTGCDVAIIMFNEDGDLSQYTSSSMEATLRRFGQACTEVHETQTREGVAKRQAECAVAASRAKRNRNAEAGAGGGGAARERGGRASGDRDTVETILAMQDLPPIAPPVDGADETIDREFEKLIEDRAKRAQQAAAEGAGGEEKPAGGAVAAPAGPTSAIDSLAAALYGNPVAPAGVLEHQQQAVAAREGGSGGAAGGSTVGTPALASFLPAVVSAEGLAPLMMPPDAEAAKVKEEPLVPSMN